MEFEIKKNNKIIEDERPDFKGLHCCSVMDIKLFEKHAIFSYDPQYREYRLDVPNGGMLLKFCIFCGKKLPNSVRVEWFDILEKEYGLEDPLGDDENRVVKDFWTDEWWKIRGL